MEEITRQVKQAQWRLNLERFLNIVGWSLFATLVVGAIGVAIPKFVVLPETVDPDVWFWSWSAGSVALGLVLAAALTYFRRRTSVEAAIELDRRFGLKERVSSSLTLTAQERETEAGQALLHDAAARVETLDVADQFKIAPGGRFALPLIPIAAMVVIAVFFNNLTPENAQKTTAANVQKIENAIKETNESLKKKIEEREKKATENGLKDAEAIFKQMNDALKDADKDKKPKDQKDALIKLNDLADALKKKREAMGGSEKIKEQLSKMKDIENGPADKAVKAMQAGDFNKAQEEMKKLKEQLAKGELTKEERDQLAKQLEQMQKKVEEAIKKHEEAKADLAEQIKQAEQAGDRQKAAELQKKLDEMKNADKQMDKMQQMADKLGKAAEQAKNGDQQQAAQQLDQLAQEMKEMQKEMDNLKMVDDMMNEVAQAKNGLCEKCKGDGEGEDNLDAEGDGGKGKKGEKPGKGLGEGQGEGDRPEEKTDYKSYDSKVGAKPKKGEAVKTGYASGANMAGKTTEVIKQELNSGKKEEDNPLVDTRLPKSQREHAKQYFEKLREGE
jgi:chemotaxis protein histidine kinase CheA